MTNGARRISVVAVFAFLVTVYALAQWRDLDRRPHGDEVEHLHVAVKMARGERVYVDFVEHHPPLYWAMLRPLVPRGHDIAAMQGFVARARILSGIVTAIAIIAAAVILRRASGNVWTVATFVALVFAAGGVWRDGLGDIRPDSTALALWWTGAALILLGRRPTLRGLGMGCVFLATMVKPQWPISSIVIGIVFLADVAVERRALLRESAVALLVAAAGLGATKCLADLQMVYFHVITMTRAMVAHLFPPGTDINFPPLFGCPAIVRPPTVLLAAAVVIAALIRARSLFAAPRLVVIFFFLAAASLAEIFFVYPYPAVHSRFYTFWVFAASALLALLPQSAAALLPSGAPDLFRKAIPIGALVLALAASLTLIPGRPEPNAYWQSTKWIEARLAPGETVWNGWIRHPIGVLDASYYWFGMPEVIPVALHMATTDTGRRFLPALTEEDLPPCRVERGLDTKVRFLAQPGASLPKARACFDRLRERGVVTPTPYSQLWMVRR